MAPAHSTVTLRLFLLAHQVSSAGRCPACTGPLLCPDPANMQDLLAFNCGHSYHAACLTEGRTCQVCSSSGQLSSHTTYYYNQ